MANMSQWAQWSPGQARVSTKAKVPWLVLISDGFKGEGPWVTRVSSAVPCVPTVRAHRPVAFATVKLRRVVVGVTGANSKDGPVRTSLTEPGCFAAVTVRVPRSGELITS